MGSRRTLKLPICCLPLLQTDEAGIAQNAAFIATRAGAVPQKSGR